MSAQRRGWRAFIGCEMDKPELFDVGRGQACLFTCRRPAKAAPNEDAAAIISLGKDRVVLVVADGMGGGAAGERASALAIERLIESLSRPQPCPANWLRCAVLEGIEQANQAILDLKVGAATTLAVVTIEQGVARPYHVGDSQVLIVGQKGKTKRQTMAHSPVGYAQAAGAIDEMEAIYHRHRHFVSNMVGSRNMHIDVGSPIRLAARDRILLASDGLSDNLWSEEIVQTLRKGPLTTSTRHLVETARERMITRGLGHPSKPDDLTVLTFRLQTPRHKP